MANPRPIGYFDEAVVQHEFRAKFNNCFVQLVHPNMPLEFWAIDASNEGNIVNFHNNAGEIFNISGGMITSDIEIVVCFPEEGWYYSSEGNQLFLLTRFPAKQWRRAPNRDNLHVNRLQVGKLSSTHLSAGILNHTINPINEGKGFKIINRKFLQQQIDDKWSLLWYLDAQIGFYSHEQNRYFMLHSWYRLPSALFKNVVYPKTFSLKV